MCHKKIKLRPQTWITDQTIPWKLMCWFKVWKKDRNALPFLAKFIIHVTAAGVEFYPKNPHGASKTAAEAHCVSRLFCLKIPNECDIIWSHWSPVRAFKPYTTADWPRLATILKQLRGEQAHGPACSTIANTVNAVCCFTLVYFCPQETQKKPAAVSLNWAPSDLLRPGLRARVQFCQGETE